VNVDVEVEMIAPVFSFLVKMLVAHQVEKDGVGVVVEDEACIPCNHLCNSSSLPHPIQWLNVCVAVGVEGEAYLSRN
jgi:hypothetical protein